MGLFEASKSQIEFHSRRNVHFQTSCTTVKNSKKKKRNVALNLQMSCVELHMPLHYALCM